MNGMEMTVGVLEGVGHGMEPSPDWAIRWEGPDQGAHTAWLAGAQMRRRDSDLAQRAETGELVPLPFRGGVTRQLKTKSKVGHNLYLAMWQGLRGEVLDVDMNAEVSRTCTRFGVPVLFTSDMRKNFAQAETEA